MVHDGSHLQTTGSCLWWLADSSVRESPAVHPLLANALSVWLPATGPFLSLLSLESDSGLCHSDCADKERVLKV